MTAPERSHLEDLTLRADHLSDNELMAVALVASKLEVGGLSSLSPAGRTLFAELGLRCRELASWRRSYVDHLGSLLSEDDRPM